MKISHTPHPVSRRIQELMQGHTDRAEEAEILSLLGQADSTTLSTVLKEVDTHALFNDVDDHLFGPKNKTVLLQMLSRERLADIDVPARAAVVDGLQRGPTVVGDEKDSRQDQTLGGGIEEQAIGQIFLGTKAEALTELKNLVNAGADHYDMHQLLNHDLDDRGIVASLMQHFLEQASAPGLRLKPMSDIDDTFYANWKDQRYPSGTVYPGVRAFYQELDRGAAEQSPDPSGDLTFLTARPEDPIGYIKDRAHQSLREHGIEEAAVLAGSLPSLIDNERIAAKKYENFAQYADIFPEYNFSWVGDSGQGDALLGLRMLDSHAQRIKGVFIHDVVGLSQAQREQLEAQGVAVFDTYVGAALEAHAKGLMSDQGLQRVATSALHDFAGITFESEPQQAQRRAELQRDLALVNDRLSGKPDSA